MAYISSQSFLYKKIDLLIFNLIEIATMRNIGNNKTSKNMDKDMSKILFIIIVN